MALVLVAAGNPIAPGPASAATGDASSVIARYQAQIPRLMAEQGVPGLAVALVDGDRVLWAQGFGMTDDGAGRPVSADTIFSVQSISKVFTATAVLQAVEAGRVALDEPITTYLPDFTVHSVFEDHPERRITLRMLLSHTAGFTHEAPIGNNFELEPGSFDEHVRSISDTWLRFPVGSGYAYSNLGIDLAGYILERVTGRPFAALMDDGLLAPLGMHHSTFDRERIRTTVDRAIGHTAPTAAMPLDVPMTAAGGLYASAADMARFLRFQLNAGTLDGRTVLSRALIDEQRRVPEPHLDARAGYALGIGRTGWYAGRNADLFAHGGGGFGFLADLWWAPQLGVGIAVLTNSTDHQLQGTLAASILRDLVHEPGTVYEQRLRTLPAIPPVVENNASYQPPLNIARLRDAAALPPTADQAARWERYVGTYRTAVWGVVSPLWAPARFVVEAGVPYFDSEAMPPGSTARFALTEVEAGLFITNDGEMVDFRGGVPTWRSLDLVRVQTAPLPWQWVLLGAIGLASLLWLLGAGVAWVRQRRRGTITLNRPPDGVRRWRRAAAALAALTELLTFAVIGLLVAVPALVDSGFLGALDFPLVQRLLLHLPIFVTLAAAGLVTLVVIGWRHWWSSIERTGYAILGAASTALVAQLAAWHLIGWGLT